MKLIGPGFIALVAGQAEIDDSVPRPPRLGRGPRIIIGMYEEDFHLVAI